VRSTRSIIDRSGAQAQVDAPIQQHGSGEATVGLAQHQAQARRCLLKPFDKPAA